ncbi:hypothetical protein BH20ACT1_BH20ACT1_08770 [soil metagenome]
MPVDERSRHQLFNHLDDVLGPEDAATLIEHLPPVGWADVATKRDLDALELRIDQRFVSVDHRFDQIDQRFDQMDQSIDERFVWFEEKFNLRLEAVKHELIAMFHRELNAQTKVIMFGMITIVLTMASLAFALVRFT